MDSMAGSVVNAVLSESLKQIDQLIDLARQSKEAELNRVLRFFDAAALAVQALEQESDAILTEAYMCDFTEPKQLRHLQVRLQTYLHEEKIRPRLRKAIVGLQDCYATMTKEATGIPAWPWKRKDRKQAMVDFSKAIASLLEYLRRLDAEMGYLPAGTGPRAIYLMQIDHMVNQLGANSLDARAALALRDGVRGYVSSARSDPTKSGWGPFIDEVRAVRHHIRRTFKPMLGKPME